MRQAVVCLSLYALLLAAPPLDAQEKTAARPKRPNILVIMTDQQPISTIGAYGNRFIKTPNLDRLAREGMRFNQFHIAAFACSPSRACYWTGQWSHHHGVVINDIVLRDDIPTLGSITRQSGYQAAFVGKWHLGGEMYVRGDKDKWSYRRVDDPDDFVYDKQGAWRGGEDQPQGGFLDKWVGAWSHYHAYLGRVGLGNFVAGNRRVGNHNMAPSGPEGTHIYSQIPPEHHEVAFLTGEAERFIRTERDRSKPFCLVLSVFGPHLPVAPPKPWDTMYNPKDVPLPANHQDDLSGKPGSQQNDSRCRKAGEWTEAQFRDYIARYWGYCSYIDQQVGRVLKALDDEGIADDTVVIFTSDHGDMIGAHGFVFKLGSGYDELMRVPFLVRYPGMVQSDTTCDALVQSIDLLPTLLDLCGLTAPPQVDGRSFRPLLEGKAKEFRDQVVTVMKNTHMLATREWKLVASDGRQSQAMVELYNRREHPLEVVNRASDPACAGVLRDMKQRLVGWLHDTGYPYADVVERHVADARTRMPRPEEMIRPRVASFESTVDDNGAPLAEFMIEWNVGQAFPEPRKYWTFVHAVSPNGQAIVTRATQWPSPPTTEWLRGSKQLVGPLRVPILPTMRGTYPVRVGLYAPETKTRPTVLGEAQRIVGTLTVGRAAEGRSHLSFESKP